MSVNRDIQADREHTLELLTEDKSTTVGANHWLGHSGGAACIDEKLIGGATLEDLGMCRGSVKGHLRHLEKEHGLPISLGENCRFDEVMLRRLLFGMPHEEGTESATVDARMASPTSTPADPEDFIVPPSSTRLDPEMCKTVAHTAKMFVDSRFVEFDKQIAGDMVMQGIRKIHDRAESKRGKRKYLGHGYWSTSALRVLDAHDGVFNDKATKKLRHEHVIPVKYLLDNFLFANPPGTALETYQKQLNKFGVVAIITRDESDRLDHAGLSRSMPSNWEKLGLFARYKMVGLAKEIESF